MTTVRILHVTSGRLYGGIEQMLVTMAGCRRLAPAVEMEFAAAAPGRFHDALVRTGAPAHLVGDVRLSSPSSVIEARSRLRALLRDSRPDVLICHAPWSYALFASAAVRERLRVVLWQHDAATGRTLVERWCRATTAALVIANSEWTARHAAALQPRVPCRIVRCPVVLPPIAPAVRREVRRAFETDDDDVVVLSASRLEPWKGQARLLEALAMLRAQTRWICWIAGGAVRVHERAYRDHLAREARRLGVESRVRFLGERNDVPELMAAADLLCQPNERPEPFGVVFAEALLAGLPVVTTAAGGAPEIVSADCGRFVRAGDAQALASALEELIADATLRARLGSAGRRQAASRCDPALVLDELARVVIALPRSAAA